MVRTQFELFLDKVRTHILDYLEAKGYNTSHAIRCINPAHDDKTPSMLCSSAESNDWRVWCTSCGWRGDIFDVYSALEGAPSKGPEWVTKTVVPLATMFGLSPPALEWSADDQFRHDLYKAYEDVAGLLNHCIEKMSLRAAEYVAGRKWTLETLERLDIGTVSFSEICDRIKSDDRDRFGLQRPDVFDSKNVVFTVRDQYNRPVRFFGRRPDDDPKYTSTTSANLAVDVWRGCGQLYLSHLLERTASSAIVVEGQADAVTLYQNGFKNAVAICGCKAFSEQHADTLALNGISSATIVYDGDEAGQKAIETLLKKEFVKSGGIRYDVVIIPEGHDPDSFVRHEGADKFRSLIENMKMTAFEFLLSKHSQSDGVEAVADDLIPYIAASKSDVSRERMARELSDFFGGQVSVGAILADVRKVDDAIISALLERKRVIVGSASRTAVQDPMQAKEVFRDAIERLDEAEKVEGVKENRTSCLSRIQACKGREEAQIAGGLSLLPGRLGALSDVLKSGDWVAGRVILIGAVQNMGKSSFLDAFVWEAVSNPDNNAIAYILSIDDPAEARFRRIMCNSIGSKDFTQNMIANPHYYASEGHGDVYELREAAYMKLTSLVAAGRLIVEDSRDGRTVAYAERRLAQIRRENPQANIIFGLDNLHDCDDWAGTDAKDRIGRIVKYVKRVAEMEKVLALCTAEYRKGDPSIPGSDEDLADTRALKYAPALTLHLFSDVHAKGENNAILVHRHKGKLRPRVVLNFGKNKITDFKKRLVFDFFPASSLFFSVPIEQAMAEEEIRKEELAKYSHVEEPEDDSD